ncbi:MAG: hypothetical protein SGARI_001615 [Bacillariaceae sp.]
MNVSSCWPLTTSCRLFRFPFCSLKTLQTNAPTASASPTASPTRTPDNRAPTASPLLGNGDTGTPAARENCDGDELAVGFNVGIRNTNAPNDITAFRLVCDAFTFSEPMWTAAGMVSLPTADGNPDTAGGFVGTSPSFSQVDLGTIRCTDPDAYLTGIRVWSRENGEDDIRAFQGICNNGETNLLPVSGVPTDPNPDNNTVRPAGAPESEVCPIGMAVTGFQAVTRGTGNNVRVRRIGVICSVPASFGPEMSMRFLLEK